MFSWKKEAKVEAPAPRRNAGQRSKGQLPLFDIPGMDEMENMDDDLGGDDDDDLEAELQALQAGLDIRKVVSRKRLEESLQPKKRVAEVESEDESDDEVDENDPDLLAELDTIEKLPSKADYSDAASTAARPNNSRAEIMKPEATTRILAPAPPPPVKRMAAPQPPPQIKTVPVNRSATAVVPPAAPTVVHSSGNPTLDLLQERLQMYKTAHQNAVTAAETAKIRRLDRGMKTLESMLKTARAGKAVNEEDIPPPVAVSSKPASQIPMSTSDNAMESVEESPRPSLPLIEMSQPSLPPPPLPPRLRQVPAAPTAPVAPSAPPLSPPQTSKLDVKAQKTIEMLTERRNQYRQAAMEAKRENDMEKTRDFVKIAKKFDLIIEAIEQGQEVDLQGMPPPPTATDKRPAPSAVLPSEPLPLKSEAAASVVRQMSIDRNAPIELPAEDVPEDPSVFKPPPPPSSILEALQQRLLKYRSAVEEANSTENSSKARRMGRIVKQYEDAIKCYKAGKPVDFDELPTPPGFAPIPTVNSGPAPKPVPSILASQSIANPEASKITPQKPSSGPAQQPPPSTTTNQALSVPKQTPPNPGVKPVQKSPLALHEKQLAAILERQKSFKAAAVDAKKRGDIQAAKEYLRVAKGFEPMIRAATCGLPVNMDSLPISPQSNAESTFELISKEDCEPAGDRDEMFEKLEKELLAQIEMCSGNRLHFSKLGDVQNTQKFETMLLNTKKDLNFVRHSMKRGDSVPRFHYETKTFSIVRAFTDLGDDDLELTIIKGINYSCPNPAEVDTYVKFEFPFPLETPQKDKTQTVKNTNNPEYNATFKLTINRKSRNCTSVFKRKGAKLEVWSKGGFLRSDSLLGTASVKLTPLETRCVLHDSFDLMEGRKPIGGKVEVKLRIREPLLTKQVDTMCEKWLIISANSVTRV